MAVVNRYDFVGIDNDTSNGELNPFGAGYPLVSETYIIKSILVTSAGTCTDGVVIGISYLNIKKEITT